MQFLRMLQAWNDLREYFEIDDGSLPDLLAVRFERVEAVSDAFEYLRSISESINAEPTLYSLHLKKRIAVTSVGNPAMLVANGEAESFCLMFNGALSKNEADFPELGVFVFPEELQFYYRPGPDWSALALKELFRILSALSKIDGFQEIEPLVPDTKYHSEFWLLFERHYKLFLTAV